MTHPPRGQLFLLPTPLVEAGGESTLPGATLKEFHRLQHFVVENQKTARRILKALGHPTPLPQIFLDTLNIKSTASDALRCLTPLLQGHDVGLMSEAGCPAIADPGATLVRLAHEHDLDVRPLVGPSSLPLALMASGLDGQCFAFQGYLPVAEGERRERLLQLEKNSRILGQTQLFIETPYRNAALFQALCTALHPTTRLCIARDLTGPKEWVSTATVKVWRQRPAPELHHLPTLFLFLAGTSRPTPTSPEGSGRR